MTPNRQNHDPYIRVGAMAAAGLVAVGLVVAPPRPSSAAPGSSPRAASFAVPDGPVAAGGPATIAWDRRSPFTGPESAPLVVGPRTQVSAVPDRLPDALNPARWAMTAVGGAIQAVLGVAAPLLADPATAQIVGPILLFGGTAILIGPGIVLFTLDAALQQGWSLLAGGLPPLAPPTETSVTVEPAVTSQDVVADPSPDQPAPTVPVVGEVVGEVADTVRDGLAILAGIGRATFGEGPSSGASATAVVPDVLGSPVTDPEVVGPVAVGQESRSPEVVSRVSEGGPTGHAQGLLTGLFGDQGRAVGETAPDAVAGAQ